MTMLIIINLEKFNFRYKHFNKIAYQKVYTKMKANAKVTRDMYKYFAKSDYFVKNNYF